MVTLAAWRVWDGRTGADILGGTKTGSIPAVAWSPDGARFAWSNYNEVVVCDTRDGAELARYEIDMTHNASAYKHVQALSWSPDGRWIASAHGKVQVWDSFNGGLRYTYEEIEYALTVAWSPGGDTVMTSSGSVHLFDPLTGERRLLVNGQGNTPVRVISSTAWSPDAARLAYVDYDGTVRIWRR